MIEFHVHNSTNNDWEGKIMNQVFEVPQLKFAFDALEVGDRCRTMEIHHGKHHAAYVANLNKALEAAPDFHGQTESRTSSTTSMLYPKPSAPRCATMAAGTPTTPSSGRRRLNRRQVALRRAAQRARKHLRLGRRLHGKIRDCRCPALRLRLGVAGGRQRQEATGLLHRQPGQPLMDLHTPILR